MDKTTVYKLDSKDKKRQWSIEVVGYEDKAVIVIESGLVGKKLVTQTIGITEGKNLGKANATTPYTQAVSEAKAKLELQLRSGYVENLEEVKESGTLRSGIKSPMLAQKHDPTGKQKGSKTLEKMKLLGKKIHVQPKYDGNRCIISIKPNESLTDAIVVMYTRKGDVMPVQLQHIITELKGHYGAAYFADGFSPDTPEWVLDGELFSTEMSFNELNGHLKRKDSQDPIALAKIKYHLYDLMLDKPYDVRYNHLKNFLSETYSDESVKYVELIPSYEVEATDENIKEKLEEFLAEGHEGLMIRTLDSPYENKRSWSLCKVKLFEDFEAKLIDIELDSMGRLGAFIMEMPKPSKDRDGKTINTFKAGTTGISHEEGLKIISNKDKYIGTMCTIEYFGLSEYLVPRFPKMKQLNRLD